MWGSLTAFFLPSLPSTDAWTKVPVLVPCCVSLDGYCPLRALTGSNKSKMVTTWERGPECLP